MSGKVRSSLRGCKSDRIIVAKLHVDPWKVIRRELTFAALMTCRPRPLPSEAPSMIPGRSSIWISAPPYSSTPGIAVSVVKEYAATSDLVLVIFDRNVDFPTDGKPTSAIRASPDLDTSKPVPAPPAPPGPGSRSWARNRASFLWGLLVHEDAIIRLL